MVGLTFLKELMLIKQANQKSVIRVPLLVFFKKGFKFQKNVEKKKDAMIY